MSDRQISQKFLNGLALKAGLEFDDIKDWIYCGGNNLQHYNYFKLCYPEATLPPYSEDCICRTKIMNNCYIRENINSPIESVLIVGSCCVEKFLPNGFTRYCQDCGLSHKRRKYNICFDCEAKREMQALSPYVYFDFPYSMKDEIKHNGAKWDDEYNLWCVNKKYKSRFVERYSQYRIADVNIFCANRSQAKSQKLEDDKLFSEGKYTTKFFAFGKGDIAKAEGYRWDSKLKKWWKALR